MKIIIVTVHLLNIELSWNKSTTIMISIIAAKYKNLGIKNQGKTHYWLSYKNLSNNRVKQLILPLLSKS